MAVDPLSWFWSDLAFSSSFPQALENSKPKLSSISAATKHNL